MPADPAQQQEPAIDKSNPALRWSSILLLSDDPHDIRTNVTEAARSWLTVRNSVVSSDCNRGA
jgi:hypothetical protein